MKSFKSSITKKLIILLALLFSISSHSLAQGNPNLGFENAQGKSTSTTEMPGVKIENKKEFFIAKNGRLMATYQTEKRIITMANIEEVEKKVIIVDGPWIITYDPVTRKGTKTKVELADQFSNMSQEEMQQMAEEIEQSTGTVSEDIGTKEILGLTCNGIRATTNMMGAENVSEIWFYKNFIMESISTGMANVKEIVIEFILGSNYDKTKLEVPSDVEITVVTSPF